MPKIEDSLQLLISLAPGYMAYCVYKIDADWRGIQQTDVIYGSFIFSVLSFASGHAAMSVTGNHDIWPFVLTTFASGLLLAIVYRVLAEPLLMAFLRRINVTNEDKRGTAWQKVFNDPRIYVTQIYAYLKDGDAVGCGDTSKFDRPDLRRNGIFAYYTHMDGQLSFVPSLRISQSGAWEESTNVEDANFGLRMVYIAPDALTRLEVRVAPATSGHPGQLRRFVTWAIQVPHRMSNWFSPSAGRSA